MSTIHSGFDLNVTIFSPEGKIYQLFYVNALINKNLLLIGMKCKDGILMIAQKVYDQIEKKNSKTRKIFTVDRFNLVGSIGNVGDINRLVLRARFDNLRFKEIYSENLSGKVFLARLRELVHLHTVYWHLRPFGCILLIGSVYHSDFKLFSIFPNGESVDCKLSIHGKNSFFLKNFVEDLTSGYKTCKNYIKKICRKIRIFNSLKEGDCFEIFFYSRENLSFEKPISCNLELEIER
ncbi:nucleophile aminohydrolase, partial [Baffinella frigidus]